MSAIEFAATLPTADFFFTAPEPTALEDIGRMLGIKAL